MAIKKLVAQRNNARNPRWTGRLKERAFSEWHSRRPRNVKRIVKKYNSLFKTHNNIARESMAEVLRRIPGLEVESRSDIVDSKTTINISFPEKMDVSLAKKTLNYVEARNAKLNSVAENMKRFKELVDNESHTAKGERRKEAQRALAEIKKTNLKGPEVARAELGAIMTTLARFVANARAPYGTKVNAEMHRN